MRAIGRGQRDWCEDNAYVSQATRRIPKLSHIELYSHKITQGYPGAIRVAPRGPIARFEVFLQLFMPLVTESLEDTHRLGLPALFLTAAPIVIRSDDQLRRLDKNGWVPTWSSR